MNGKEEKAKIEKQGESKERKTGRSTFEAEKRLDGKPLTVHRCSLRSKFKELVSVGWLFREKGRTALEGQRNSQIARKV